MNHTPFTPVGGPLDLYRIDPRGRAWLLPGHPMNLVLFGASDIQARLAGGDQAYALSHVYFEFVNTADPGSYDPPAFDRSGGRAYYAGLDSVANTDFLRVSLDHSPTFSATADDFAHNRVRLFAMTNGAEGFHGTAFSQASNSHVVGAALVATPTDAFAGDIVFSRVYFPSPIAVLADQSVGFGWPLTFTPPDDES